jgi:cell division septum initiation protein DivIVA
LENVADKIDDLAEKLESFNSKLQKSIQQTTVTVSSEFQQNAQNAQLSLENTAKAINDLADDVERAKKSSTPAFRSLIGEEITAVNQSLEAATKAIKAFIENPI